MMDYLRYLTYATACARAGVQPVPYEAWRVIG